MIPQIAYMIHNRGSEDNYCDCYKLPQVTVTNDVIDCSYRDVIRCSDILRINDGEMYCTEYKNFRTNHEI